MTQHSHRHSLRLTKPLIQTLKQRRDILERWRLGVPDLTELDKACAMQILWDTTYQATTKHYRNPNGGTKLVPFKGYQWYHTPRTELQRTAHEAQMARVLFLGEMLRDRLDKGVGWSISAYRARVAGIESLIQIQLKGVGTPKSEQSIAAINPNKVVATLRKLYSEDREYPPSDSEIAERLVTEHKNIRNVDKAMLELQNYRSLKALGRPNVFEDYQRSSKYRPEYEDDNEVQALIPHKEGEQCLRKFKSYTWCVT